MRRIKDCLRTQHGIVLSSSDLHIIHLYNIFFCYKLQKTVALLKCDFKDDDDNPHNWLETWVLDVKLMDYPFPVAIACMKEN